MVKWVFNDIFIKGHEMIFYIYLLVIIMIMISTVFLVKKEIKGNNNVNK